MSSPTSVREALRERSRAAFCLRNCGDKPIETQVSGHFYVFPHRDMPYRSRLDGFESDSLQEVLAHNADRHPNRVGQVTHPALLVDPARRRDVEIQDRLNYKRGKRGALLMNEPKVLDGEGASAADIAAEILHEDRLGMRGLAIVYPGDEAGNDERCATARGQYIKARVERAKQLEAAHHAKCALVAQDPRALPPRQSAELKEELEFLYRFEAGTIDRAAYISVVDGFESDSLDEVMAHNAQRYPDRVATGDPKSLVKHSGGGAVRSSPMPATDRSQPAPVVARPAAYDPKVFLDLAEKYEVNLLKDELRGLLLQDPAVIDTVTTKLAQARLKKEATDGK